MFTIDKLKADLATGRISRRQFMEGALVLGLTVAAATGAGRSALAAPKRGGEVRIGCSGACQGYGPSTYFPTPSRHAWSAIIMARSISSGSKAPPLCSR